jgi:hypothetical protein
MKRLLLIVVLLVLPFSLSYAQQLSPQSRAEIEHLVQFIQTSSCQFNRNGSWHSAAEAAEHISKKYHYAFDRGQIHSAEDFIRHAATKSSLSGQIYTVRCGNGRTESSADWLTAELRRLRAAAE